MKALNSWWAMAALFALALVIGLSSGTSQLSMVPSVNNVGPRGLKVLATYLTEAGFDVRQGLTPLTELPDDVATVVIPAPVISTLDAADRQALRTVLERGKTVVLLPSRSASFQQWQGLADIRGGPRPVIQPQAVDGSGTTAVVKFQVGALRGVTSLRLSADPGIRVATEGAVALTEPPLLWAVPGAPGELYVIAGADLAENARLDLADNLRFWTNLATRGPVWIDESHHAPRLEERPSVNLWATGLQFIAVAALFVLARGTRFGPPRDDPRGPRRSTTEYVEAMAALTARAGQEAELVAALRKHARLLMHDRLGVPLALPDTERPLALTAAGVDPNDARALFAELDFLRLSQCLARVETRLAGRR